MMELKDFNEKFHGSLEIAVSESEEILSIVFEPSVWIGDSVADFDTPTQAELNEIIINLPEIGLIGKAGRIIHHKAPNGKHFTAGDICAAVEETEKQTRNETEWFGGIDLHHIYFEGLDETEEKGVYRIYWGS